LTFIQFPQTRPSFIIKQSIGIASHSFLRLSPACMEEA